MSEAALDRMIDRMPGLYADDPDSNLAKLLSLDADEIDDLVATAARTLSWRSISLAEGETLNQIGENAQQLRGQSSDPVYRILIRSKIARNLSDGTVERIIRVLSAALDTDATEVLVNPLWDESTPESASVFISVPSAALNAAGFSLSRFGKLCGLTVAAGIKADVMFRGTFELSSSSNSVDSSAGFNELVEGEPGDIGGYLGAVYDPAHEPELPL